MENNYKNLTLEDITKTLNEVMLERDNNPNEKADFIINEYDGFFMCKSTGGRFSITTGIGGFKILLKEFGSLEMLKVEWNGSILNKEQKQQVYEHYSK